MRYKIKYTNNNFTNNNKSYIFKNAIITNSLFDKYGGANDTTPTYYTPIEIRNKLIDFLEIILKVFSFSNVNYSIYGGTLLGAVRHQDIIPWDDDIDLLINEKELNKLFSTEFKQKLKENNLSIYVTNYNDKNISSLKIWENNGQNTGYKWKFPCVDIFVNYYYDNKYTVTWKKNVKYILKDEFESLTDYKFNRLIVKGIKNPKSYLSRYYPDWEINGYVSCWDHVNERVKNGNCGFKFLLK